MLYKYAIIFFDRLIHQTYIHSDPVMNVLNCIAVFLTNFAESRLYFPDENLTKKKITKGRKDDKKWPNVKI